MYYHNPGHGFNALQRSNKPQCGMEPSCVFFLSLLNLAEAEWSGNISGVAALHETVCVRCVNSMSATGDVLQRD
jgi:hypothetical protein